MKKQFLFVLLLILSIGLFSSLCAQVSPIENTISGISTNDVQPGVVVPIAKDAKANFNILKDTIQQIKAGKWEFILPNLIAILALIVGLSRWIAQALILILKLVMKLTPDKIDVKLAILVNGLSKFIEWLANVFGWLSFSKSKGTNASNSVK